MVVGGGKSGHEVSVSIWVSVTSQRIKARLI